MISETTMNSIKRYIYLYNKTSYNRKYPIRKNKRVIKTLRLCVKLDKDGCEVRQIYPNGTIRFAAIPKENSRLRALVSSVVCLDFEDFDNLQIHFKPSGTYIKPRR